MSYHTATVDEENGIMLVFGGEPFQDISWVLDLTDMKWRSTDVQYRRTRHSANLIGRSIYLFGGYHLGN